jgi:pyruvate dehydrogenase (quinone)
VDYAAIAAACGLLTSAVDDPAEVRGALAEALAYDGPSLVDVRTDPNAL